MIGVEGQYLFRFSLGSFTDFINEVDLVSFTLIEETGNVLPTFSICFNTQNESILPLMHEGNNFKVSFGQDRSAMVDVPLSVMRLQTNRLGDSKRIITAAGMYAAVPYLSDKRIFISDQKSGVEVLKDAVGKYFKPVFNIEKSQDIQRWIQPNQSDKKYVNECWIHSDLGSSFPAVGITSEGRFILKDIKLDLKSSTKWNFTRFVKDESKDIPYDGDFLTDINTGFINSWMGYGREKLIYNLEDGTEELTSEKPDPIIALTKQLAQRSDIQARFASTGVINDNVHPSYWSSALKNVTQLAAFGNVMVKTSFVNRFQPVQILDRVNFKDENVESQKSAASEFNSGVYYITKVARSISSRTFTTTVCLGREALNQIKVGL